MVTLNGIGGDLTKTEFEIGGTRFAVAKLPAMAGFDLLKAIRHELGKSQALSLPTEVLKEDDRSIAAFLKIVLSLDPAFVRQVRQKLFEKVAFSNTRVPTPQQLAGAEEDGLRRPGAHRYLRNAGAECSRKFYAVLRRPRLQVERRPPGFEPVSPLGIKPFFGALIDAELAEYLEIKERLSLDEALDLYEVLVARIENEHRSYAEAERKAKEKRQEEP